MLSHTRTLQQGAKSGLDLPTVFEIEQPAAFEEGSSAAASSRVKRAFDVVAAILGIIAFLPLLLLICLLVRLESPGPVVFRQRRGGLGGRPFEIFKFRTMSVVEQDGPLAHATKTDPRVTRIGGFLRRSSLDELPQLFNVLRGEMSIIGPRPHAVFHDEYYSERIPDYMDRLKTRPGLTGLAQVSGYRGEIRDLEDMQRRIDCDLAYIRDWSLTLDMRLLVKTIIIAPFDPMAY
ncbi:exopolysaccharide biosynthesis polyprenyl glycosylphosphotransferase [Phenylobacterium montanum]|uniref:Exopolysaccharide biosynthesis polyprenyl glycosylphosphotransferase n=2 Tax=Phenylobacterium montanum TaxID=2823693 RepID=A0A975IX21_9CAUL|nr:exopolysaccharide biosynthesis polyprenyl glycosylphosphotransferase [Caulobacter sp. S6]